VVTNCTLESIATAIKLGTGSEGDFRDLHFSNCTVRNSTVGIGFFIKDGGTAERVTFSNISISTLDDPSQVVEYLQRQIIPVYIDIEQRRDTSPIGAVRDVTFRDIYIHSDNGILIQGMRQSPIENLSLHNVTLRVDRGYPYGDREKHRGGPSNPNDDRITCYARQPSYVTLAHVDGLVVEDVRVLIADEVLAQYDRRALSIHETRNAAVRGIVRTPAGGGQEAIVHLENCEQVAIANCVARPGTGAFLELAGGRTAAISLVGNDLRAAQQAVRRAPDVPAEAIQ